MSRLANASAADVYSVALAASPVLVASSAIRTAWRALAPTFSSSSSLRLSCISVCLLVGDDVRRLLLEPAVLVLRLGDGLFELDLGIGLLVERHVQLGAEVLPPLLEGLEHGVMVIGPVSSDRQRVRRRRAPFHTATISSTPSATPAARYDTRTEGDAHRDCQEGPGSGVIGKHQTHDPHDHTHRRRGAHHAGEWGQVGATDAGIECADALLETEERRNGGDHVGDGVRARRNSLAVAESADHESRRCRRCSRRSRRR